MKGTGKVVLSLLTLAVAAGAAYIIKRLHEAQNEPITDAEIKHKDTLTLTELVDYFKNLNLDEELDTPFLCTNPEHFNVRKSVNPESDEKVLFIGVYRRDGNKISDYVLVYSHNYDDALKNVLTKSVDGVVTLS